MPVCADLELCKLPNKLPLGEGQGHPCRAGCGGRLHGICGEPEEGESELHRISNPCLHKKEKACEASSKQPKRPPFGGVLQQSAPKKLSSKKSTQRLVAFVRSDIYYAEQRWDSSQQMPLRRDGSRTSDRSFNHCGLFSVEACTKASKRQELLYCTRGVMFYLACVDASIGQVHGTSCTRGLFLRTAIPEVGCTSKWWAEIGELPRGYTSNNHFPCCKS